MLTPHDVFENEVRTWVDRLGLKDWYVDFKLDEESLEVEAQVEYDKNTRHATFTYFAAAKKSYYPERLALHEVLHLLMADVIPADCSGDVAREEHRMIERLLHVLL